MRISAVTMPLIAIATGAVGFYMRLTELMSVFDEYTGLPQRGASITIALIVVSAMFLVFLFLFALRATLKYKAQPGFEKAFGTDYTKYPIAFSVYGVIWLGATVARFIELYSTGQLPLVELLFMMMSALSAVSVAFFAIEMYREPRHRLVIVLSIVPTLFMCFWLILMYRQNATNPILISYAYYCLAIIASALGFYFTSGFAYNKPAPGKAIFSFLAAVYFCFVTLADDHMSTDKIILVVIIGVNTAYASMLIKNLEVKERE